MPLFNPSGEGNIVSGSGNTAGTLTTFNSGTFVLAGGNNITLSQSSNSISIVGAAGGTGGAAITLGESNLGNTSGTSGVISGSALQFLLAGGNNVTLSQSLNGSSITVTISGANQTNQSLGLYAVSNTTLSTSHTADARSLSFEGAGIVSIGASNGSLQISATQSNQQISAYAVSNTTQSTSGTLNASNLSLEGAGGVSVGVSNGSIIISGATGGAAGANTLGMSNLGNTSGTSGVISGSAVELFLVGGNNVTLSQSINGSTATISISAANQSNQQLSLYAVSNTTQSSSGTGNASALSFEGAGIISAGISNGSVVLSATQSVDTGHVYASSNTFGTSSGSYNVGTLSIAGSGAVSVAASNSGFVISAPTQTNQTLGLYASSNTTGQSSSSTVDARSLTIEAVGNLSVGLSGGSLIISGATAAAGTLTGYAVSNTTQGTSGTLAGNALSFEGAGNVSVGISNGSIVISGSGSGGDTNLSAYAVSNTTLSTSGTIALSALSLEGAGAASVGVSNGSLVISAPAQTNQSLGIYAESNTTGQSSSSTVDARSLYVGGYGAVSVGLSAGTLLVSLPANSTITEGNMVTISTNGQTVTIDAFANILSVGGNTSGTLTTFSSGTMVLAGGNNVTLSQSSNTITISAGAGGSGATSVGAYAVSNTTLSTSGTLANASLSFEGAGNVSVGISNGSIVISGATAAGNTNVSAYAVSNTTQGTSGTIAQSAFSFEGAGGVSVGVSNGSIVASAPVESYLVAGNNITLSSSSNSITIADLLTSETISQLEPWDAINNSSASSLGQSSLYLQHFNVPASMQVCRMDRLISLSINGTITGNTNSTGTRSNVWAYNETIGAFTRGTGANSTNLYSYMSNGWSLGITESVSVVTTVATSEIAIQASYTFGFIGNIDTNGGTTSSTFSSSSSLTTASSSGTMANPVSNITGVLALNVPFGSNLMTAGDYWLGLLGDTAVTTSGTATTNASISNIVLTNYASDLKRVGQTATATSNTLIPGNGAFSAQTAAFPSSLAINAVSNNSNVSLYGNFMNLSM